MNNAPVWKDISSYKRGEKATSEPKTSVLRCGVVSLIVTRHVHYPGRWLAECEPFLCHYVCENTTLEGAKAEALKCLKEEVEELSSDLSIV